MIRNRRQLEVGCYFDLRSRPGHFFRLDCFARPVRPGEIGTMTDLVSAELTHLIECPRDEATHVKGWNSYACLPSIPRLLRDGNLKGK